MKIPFITRLGQQSDEHAFDFPIEYLIQVGWCQDVTSCKRDENGNIVAYTLEGAIDAWGRNGWGRSKYVVPVKHEVSRILGKGILTFWNDDLGRRKSDVINVLRKAEQKVITEDEAL